MNNIFLLNWISDTMGKMGMIIPGMIRTWFYDICSFIYGMISYFYQVFEVLCSGKILSSDELGALFGRISVLLGIVMMFRITITFIQALIDPDSGLGDKEKGIQNVIVKVVVVIIMFGLSNYVFDLAADIQGAIIEKNVIAEFLLPGEVDTKKFGGVLAADLFTSFYDVDPDVDPSKFKDAGDAKIYDCVQEEKYINGLRFHIRDANDFDYMKDQCLLARGEYAGTDDGVYVIKFNYVFSPVVGIVVLWFLINYCLSVGIRIIQLAFLQIISPIAFIGYLEPKSDNMFTRWLKTYISTYVDVFIRMAIISFVCYICGLIMEGWNDHSGVFWTSVGNPEGMVARVIGVLVILALFEFAKKAPELIKNIFPVGSSGIGFGTNKEAFSPLRSAATFGLGAATGIGLTAAMGAKGAIAKRNAQKRNLEGLNLEKPNGRLPSLRQLRNRDARRDYMRGARDRWRQIRGTADSDTLDRLNKLDEARRNYKREVSDKTRNAALYGFATGTLAGATHGFRGVTHGFKGEKIGEKVKGAWKAQNESDDKFDKLVTQGGTIRQIFDSKIKGLVGETLGQSLSRVKNNNETAASYRDEAYDNISKIGSIQGAERVLNAMSKDENETEAHFEGEIRRKTKNINKQKDCAVKGAVDGQIGYLYDQVDLYDGLKDSSYQQVKNSILKSNSNAFDGLNDAQIHAKVIERCKLIFKNDLEKRRDAVISDYIKIQKNLKRAEIDTGSVTEEEVVRKAHDEIISKFGGRLSNGSEVSAGLISDALAKFDIAASNDEIEFTYDFDHSEVWTSGGDIRRSNQAVASISKFKSHCFATGVQYYGKMPELDDNGHAKYDADGNVIYAKDASGRELEPVYISYTDGMKMFGESQFFIESRKFADNTVSHIYSDPRLPGALAADKANGIDSNATSIIDK